MKPFHNRHHPRLRRVVSILILVLFFGWAAYYIAQNHQSFGRIFAVPPLTLAVLYLIYLAALFVSGLFTKFVMQAFAVNVGVWESFHLSAATSAANYMTFLRGGAGVRALYLRAKHDLPFVEFISSLAALYLLQLIASGVLGLLGMVLLVQAGKPFDWPFTLFFGSSVVICSAIMLSGVRLKEYQRFPLKQTSQIINGWALIKKQPRLLTIFFLINLLYFLIIALQSKIAFGVYGVDLSWRAVIFYSAGQVPVSYANLTPGALGVQESFTIYMGRVFQYTTAQAMMVQGLIRFVSLTTLLILGPLALKWLTSKKVQAPDQTVNR